MSSNEPNDTAQEQMHTKKAPGETPMESVAGKTPLDYLMFVTWVLQIFFVSLGGLVIGYCLFILPNDYPRCARFSFALDVLLVSMICAVCPLVRSKRESGESSNYWDREENAAVKWAIDDMWWLFAIGVPFLFSMITLFQHIPRNHSLSACLQDDFGMWIFLVWLLMIGVLNSLTLDIVKWSRVKKHNKTTTEPQSLDCI